MARLAVREAGLQILELNASDTRSKRALDEHVRDILNQTTFPVTRSRTASQRQAIVMDECDGMSTGDRGGIAELIQLIKRTKSPVICICNDRSSPMVRNLAHYCLDLRLRRPDARQVGQRLRDIATAEGLQVQANAIEELVSRTHGDLRQILNVLQSHRLICQEMTFDASKAVAGKDVDVDAFEAVAALLGTGFDHRSMSARLDLYFVDDGLVPLMIQDNYAKFKPLQARPFRGAQPSKGFNDYYVQAGDAISASEHLSSLIRGANQEWWLAPAHGFLSSVLPAYLVHGSGSGRLDFPAWFGHNSRAQKFLRLTRTLAKHTYLRLSLNWRQLAPIVPVLARKILTCLTEEGVDGCIHLLDDYNLTKDDMDAVIELAGCTDYWSKQVPSNVKSALTRSYNQRAHMLPYALHATLPVTRIAIDLPSLNDDQADENEDATLVTNADKQLEGEEADDVPVPIAKPTKSSSRKNK